MANKQFLYCVFEKIEDDVSISEICLSRKSAIEAVIDILRHHKYLEDEPEEVIKQVKKDGKYSEDNDYIIGWSVCPISNDLIDQLKTRK